MHAFNDHVLKKRSLIDAYHPSRFGSGYRHDYLPWLYTTIMAAKRAAERHAQLIEERILTTETLDQLDEYAHTTKL